MEYSLARSLLALLDRLSFVGAARLSRVVARLWWLVDRRRRLVATDNIVAAGIESERGRARRLGRRSVEHFALLVIESLKSADLLDGERWRDHLEVDIAPDTLEVLEDPEQALIVVSGHLGNWELGAQWLSRFKPVAGITRPMNNPRVEELVQARKPRYRFHPIPKYGANAGRLVSVLSQREILALLNDQHARAGGVMIDFFGRPAKTYPTPAMLHLVTRTPLSFITCVRIADRRFRLSVSPLLRYQRTGKRQEDVSAILSEINRRLEAAIRAAPDQYLWAHRRWR